MEAMTHFNQMMKETTFRFLLLLMVFPEILIRVNFNIKAEIHSQTTIPIFSINLKHK